MKIKLKQLLIFLLITTPFFIWLSFYERKTSPTSQDNIANHLHPVFSTSHWGMHVIDANTKETIASYHPSHFFIPASITKIFTAAAALETLGPSYTFDTIVASSALPDDEGNIQGNIYLIGGADPFLDSRALQILAEQMYDQGVRSIEGEVIADDSLFNGPSLPTHGEWEDLTTGSAPEQSALSVNGNIVEISIVPHPAGRGLAFFRADQEVPYCQFINLVKTQRNVPQSILIARELNSNTVELKGSIPPGLSAIKKTFAIHAPQEYARQIFIQALEDCGISCEQKPLQQDASHPYEIARYSSLPLSDIISMMNKQSDSLAASLLFKYLAQYLPAESSSLYPLEKWMNQLSIKPQEYALYDGSGLSRHNLITPLQTVKLLDHMLHSSHKDNFISSLPVAGMEGTTIHRLRKKHPNIVVRAKTGHLSGICNLAGFIEISPTKELIFAIYINNSLLSGKELDEALDALLLHIIAQNSENNLSYDH